MTMPQHVIFQVQAQELRANVRGQSVIFIYGSVSLLGTLVDLRKLIRTQ